MTITSDRASVSPAVTRLLIANRGEVAIRIARACAELGVASVAAYPEDDRLSLHVRKADDAVRVPGRGAAAYLDGAAIVAAAKAAGCDAIHPGYGFLSESADFARLCAEAGLVFVGPSPEVLGAFGDKVRALAAAREAGVTVAEGSQGPTSFDAAEAFMGKFTPGTWVMVKAVAGGGGRGMRVVRHPSELREAWDRCAAEAQAAFGRADLYIEEYIPRARHIEVQIVGDVYGNVLHLFERECSVQRRHQKIIELAPSPWLPPELRDRLAADAVRLAQTTRYVEVGTVEFLVEVDERGASTGRHIFIELNPRLQVEHTVTEEVLNVDIVRAQLQIARGLSLDEIGLRDAARRGPVGFAMQLRINTEVFAPDGSLRAASGTIAAFNPSSGKGVRVETAGYAGATIHPGFDALLAKLVVSAPDLSFPELTARAYRALCEFQVEGVETNLPLLQKLVRSDEFIAGRIDTGYVDRHAKALAASGADSHPKLHPPAQAGVQDRKDERSQDAVLAMHPGCEAFRSPMGGTLVALHVAEGAFVRAGQAVGIVEAMKMENVLAASASGRIEAIVAGAGHAVQAGDILFMFSPAEETSDDGVDISGAAESSRALVEDMLARKEALLDEGRPEAMAKLAKRGSLSARARISALCDSDSFQEIGGFVRAEYARDDAPADGMILGTGKIDGRPVVVIAQDFSVYGGSSGHLGSAKLDRAATIALQAGIPLIMLLDGGGHRIQDGQSSRHYASGAGIIMQELAHLSGWAPIVGAILGFGFAGNTNFTAFADHLVMVRKRAVMGIAGPALVKVATGETISTEALGGADVQVDQNGLADVGVESEEAAFESIRKFLSYLPSNAAGPAPVVVPARTQTEVERAQALLDIVPANTRRSYDVRRVIELIADEGSVYEKKPTFARNIVTSFARLDGRPVGFIANQSLVAGGMLDAPACEKGAHFIAICDAFGLPIIYLIDVPGVAVGSAAEKTTLGRRSAKLVHEIGQSTVPRVSVVLRKGYGMGYVAMGGGRSFEPDASFAWPTAEVCAMSIDGAVDVAYRKDYEAAPDPVARRKEIIDDMRSRVSAVQAVEGFGIDDLIDPRTTRARLIEVLARAPARRVTRRPPKFRSIAPI